MGEREKERRGGDGEEERGGGWGGRGERRDGCSFQIHKYAIVGQLLQDLSTAMDFCLRKCDDRGDKFWPREHGVIKCHKLELSANSVAHLLPNDARTCVLL